MALIDIEDLLLVNYTVYCKEVLSFGVQHVDRGQKAALHTKLELDQRHLLIESDRGINVADIGSDSLG